MAEKSENMETTETEKAGSFNPGSFRSAKLETRTAEVPVPELKAFFKDGPPVWKVRNLTGNEIAVAKNKSSVAQNFGKILEGLTSGVARDQANAIKEAIGVADDLQKDTIYRFAVLVQGSVEPTIEQDIAVRLCDKFPTVFIELTNKILELTGLGAENVSVK